MGKNSSKDERKNEGAGRLPWWMLAAILAVAAGPAFFFANPMTLHMDGEMRAYWGITIFAPAILGGVAFFREVPFGAVRGGSLRPEMKAVAWILSWVAIMVVMSVIFERWSSGMASMRPVDDLLAQIPLWALCGILGGYFWQGLFQRNFGEKSASGVRVVVTALVGVAVWAPFAIHGSETVVTHLLPTLLIGYLFAAVLHELGLAVWMTSLWHGVWFAGLTWFRQALLL